MKTPKSKFVILLITAAALITVVPVLNGYQTPETIIPLDPNLTGKRHRAILTVYYESGEFACPAGIGGPPVNLVFSLWVRDSDIVISGREKVCNPVENADGVGTAVENFMDTVYNDSLLCETNCDGGITALLASGAGQGDPEGVDDPLFFWVDIRFVVNEP